MSDIEFGIDWTKMAGKLGQKYIPPVQRHAFCAYHNVGNGAFWHRRERISAFWPDNYESHEWSDRRLKSGCNHNWVGWAGPGGCGKTTDAAVQGLEWWLQAPDRTAVIMCSTTMKMLRKRIWAQVAHYHQSLPQIKGAFYGDLIDSDTMIRWKKGDTKNGIFGMAVEEGPIDEIVNNLIGIHTHRVWLMLDELQGVREAIIKATRNMAKNPVFKFTGMGNPESQDDLLGRVCEPIGGWGAFDEDVDSWEVNPGPVKGKGWCERFDGRRSPAVLDPEFARRNPWMINQDQIDNDLRSVKGNEKDPSYCSQTLGLWPRTGLESTVLDLPIIERFNCREKAIWTHGFTRVAALDPAFTEGGDKKILQFGRMGEVHDDEGKRWVIMLDETIDVPIDGTGSKPVEYQILEFCRDACKLKGIPPSSFASDSSGIGRGLKSVFDVEWGEIEGVEFGGKPTDRPVDESDQKQCDEAYDRMSTELNLAVRTFAMANGLRGLGKEAESQFCARKTIYKNKKTVAEKKSDMKLRTQKSPDEADAVAILVELCRRKGAVASAIGGTVNREPQTAVYRQDKDEYSSSNYLTFYSLNA
jgi:hypothetical protein